MNAEIGQAREVVPRQEALGGEVAIRVEVGLEVSSGLIQEQLQLLLRLVAKALSPLLLVRRLRVVTPDGVLDALLGVRGTIEVSPTVGSLIEPIGAPW